MLPSAILCDIDKTLALLNGRNPYDASTCEEDTVNEPIADILDTYDLAGCIILLISGREEKHREATERWLHHHTLPYTRLFLRSTGDRRHDFIVKQEIYERDIREYYTIKFVLEDRNQTVVMWRDLGLICLQVRDGDY